MPLSNDEIDALLGTTRKATNLQSAPVAPAPAPASTSALQNTINTLSSAASGNLSTINSIPGKLIAAGNLSWFDRNQRKDEQGNPIPIDIEQGLDIGPYQRMVWQRRPEERIAVLRKLFPNQTVRLSDTDEPIVEVTDKTGKRKDVLINPPGIDPRDSLELLTAVPQMIGSTVGAVGGGAAAGSVGGPIGTFVGAVAGGAGAAGLVGGAQDVAARAAEGLDVNLGEIAKTRTVEGLGNAAIDTLLGGMGKVFRVASPFAGSKGPLQFDLLSARDYFEKRAAAAGKKFEYTVTPAERSGSELLARLEATEKPQPGSSMAFNKIYKADEKTVSDIVNTAVTGTVPENVVGESVIRDVRKSINEPLEAAVESARDELLTKGEKGILDVFDSLTGGVGPTGEKAAGAAVRRRFKAAQVVATKKVDQAYAAVRALPGGTGKVLPTSPILDAFQGIMSELPEVITATEKKAFDQYGNPIAKQVLKPEKLKSSMPEGLQTFLTDMQKQRGQKMSLDELKVMKNAAYDEIARTEAVPGVKDRWFNAVAKGYEQAIDEGIDTIADPKLKAAFNNAKAVYKTEKLPLDRQGLSDILRTPYEAGFKSEEQLVNRLFTGGQARHNYEALRDTLGKDSLAFRKVKRSLLDNWSLEATDEVTGRINPAVLEAKLKAFKVDQPEIYKDIVGNSGQQLFTTLRGMGMAGKELADVNREELMTLLRSGNVTSGSLAKLRDAQLKRDNTYLNELFSGASEAATKPIEPVQVVNALRNTGKDPTYVADLLSKLDAKTLENLRTAELYRIFNESAAVTARNAPDYLRKELLPVSAEKMMKALGTTPKDRARTELLLGPENTALVENLIKLKAPRELKQEMFGAAGGMAATGRLNELIHVPLRYMKSWAQRALLAVAYTSEPAGKLLSNEVFGPAETTALANMLIGYEPFARKLVEVYGKDAAIQITVEAKNSIDKFMQQDFVKPASQAQGEEITRFLRGDKGAKVKMEARP